MAPMFGTPGSMALPKSGNAASSGMLRRPRLPTTRAAQALTVAGIAAAAGAGVQLQRSGAFASLRQRQGSGFKLPRPVMEVICGAVGEMVQVACLFPLDTIKVRCQASGQGAHQVTAQLLKGGLTRNVIGQLYAGVVSTSICSVAIGSLYYLTFCTAKRAAENARSMASVPTKSTKQQGKQRQEEKQQKPQAGQQQQRQQEQEQQQQQYMSDEGEYRPHMLLASISSSAISSDSSRSSNSSSSSSSSSKQGPSSQAQAVAKSDSAAAGGKEKGDSLSSNLFASCAAALVGALVEAPVELFKHQAQVGMLQGNMLAHMATTARTGGLGALYPSFLPFCFKSLPFDIGELLTYSQLQDARASATGKGSALAALPSHALDMAIGAAAGAVAVLVSMPCDCIKTIMETSPNLGSGSKSPLAGASEFAATARQLVAKNGPKALYVGIGPRLLEQVPSTMLYWLAVEGCRRMLEPYTAPA